MRFYSPLVNTDDFTATIRGNSLLLYNQTDRPVHYILAPTGNFATILRLVCAGPSCPSVAPGAKDTVVISDALASPNNPKLFLHWWHAFPSPNGGFHPDSVRTGRIFP